MPVGHLPASILNVSATPSPRLSEIVDWVHLRAIWLFPQRLLEFAHSRHSQAVEVI